MRFLSAPLIYSAVGQVLENGLLVVDNGRIIELRDDLTDIPHEKIEFFDGILCPGFVNAHCHLELSFLKNELNEGQGLPGFISEIVSKRNADPERIEAAIEAADLEMEKTGIVAVGDISNGTDSIQVKQKSKLFYHTFVEVFDLTADRCPSAFQSGLYIQKQFSDAGLRSTLAPHAPYSTSPELLDKLFLHSKQHHEFTTIHNQETATEDLMFAEDKGVLVELLKGFDESFATWGGNHSSSLDYTLSHFEKSGTLQLVHNTFATNDEVNLALQRYPNLYWCICARANQFIEKVNPPVELLSRLNCKLTIGTDSYASNWSLSILDELKHISGFDDSISLEQLLISATINGANFLGLQQQYGSFQVGKSPGVNFIANIDLRLKKLRNNSFVTKVC